MNFKKYKRYIIQKNPQEVEFINKYGFIINHQANLWTYDDEYYRDEGFNSVDFIRSI